ncbi:MAG: serine/threonine-protein kinase [Polyangiaceae bacterium]
MNPSSIPTRMIGRYALVGEIASGGMATVHYGRLVGVAGFTKPVAIKRLHPHFAKDPDFAAMFLDEARLAAQVRHPNVVSLLDVVVERGELFLVMELVRGEVLSRLVRPARADLSQVRATGGMPVDVAVAITVGMLEGLHAAHEARGEDGEPLGIVHRDVSPQNLLVGVDGIARVIDFGVAKAVGQSRVTREGQIKGKVAYMAPEQLRAKPLDRRADVYSAAVVLWEVLAGRRLFAEAESDAALVQLALGSAPELPSAHRPDLPVGLDAVVMRGLARDAGARFATAREMAKALERVVAPAAPREVGLWVEAAAGATIRERALRIEDMEAASVVTLAPEEAAALSEKLGNDVTPPGAAEPAPPGELSSISVSTARPARCRAAGAAHGRAGGTARLRRRRGLLRRALDADTRAQPDVRRGAGRVGRRAAGRALGGQRRERCAGGDGGARPFRIGDRHGERRCRPPAGRSASLERRRQAGQAAGRLRAALRGHRRRRTPLQAAVPAVTAVPAVSAVPRASDRAFAAAATQRADRLIRRW